MPMPLEERLHLAERYLASEQMGELTVEVPRRVVLEPPLEGLQQQRGSARVVDLLVHRAARSRLETTREEDLLWAVDQSATHFVGVRGLRDQASVLVDLSLAASR